MSLDVTDPLPTAEPEELVALLETLRPRLGDLAGPVDVDAMVRAAFAELGPVRVTTYLPILVERQVRQRVRPERSVDVREARVIA